MGRKIDDSVYIWRLCTCSVKDVTLLLGTVERWWLKQKRTKHRHSTEGTFKYDIFDSSTTSTHFTVPLIFGFFCSLCFLTGWVRPCKDTLAPALVASHSPPPPNRISKGLGMWGETESAITVTRCLLFHLERIRVCACVRDRYHLSPSDTQNAHLQKCGWHLHGSQLWAVFPFSFVLSPCCPRLL